MLLQVDARLSNGDAFRFEKLFLQRCVGFANQDFAVCAENTMPGDPFAFWCSAHSAACCARASWETQGFSNGPIS